MADRFDKFTERARRVLTLAQEEALRFNHNYIGTEHLFLGLTKEGEGVASIVLAELLAELGVEVAKVRSAVELIVGRGDRAVKGEIGLTDRAKKVIELSVDEARRMGHHYIGTEHLLLGLVREGDGIPAGVLESLGISLDKVRRQVTAVLSESHPLPSSVSERGYAELSRPHPLRTGPAQVIDGKAIAAEVRTEVAERAKTLHAKGVTPGLALVLVGDNPSSLSYVRSKGTTAEEAGLYSEFVHLPESTSEADVIAKVQALNAGERIHGILVQLPLPKEIGENRVIAAIDPAKDADGVTATSLGRLMRGEPGPWPATPAGVVELLHRAGYAPAGKHVVVCGRSNIVGKPLANILMQKSEKGNATVTLCHTGTRDLGAMTRTADILISAMGVAGAITADMVKPGAVVIDVGNNWVEDASRKSGRRLVGDVDYEAVKEIASAITPVPGGVGPMTIAMLLSNTVMLAEGRSATD